MIHYVKKLIAFQGIPLHNKRHIIIIESSMCTCWMHLLTFHDESTPSLVEPNKCKEELGTTRGQKICTSDTHTHAHTYIHTHTNTNTNTHTHTHTHTYTYAYTYTYTYVHIISYHIWYHCNRDPTFYLWNFKILQVMSYIWDWRLLNVHNDYWECNCMMHTFCFRHVLQST